jgi:pilus assembly protein Flp/PilA
MITQLLLRARNFLLLAKSHTDEGQGLIEYALIVILISIVVILVLGLVGGQINGMFEKIANGFGT